MLEQSEFLHIDISGITSLNISNKAISDLTGIEDFEGLIDLDCSINSITDLDVGKNQLLQTLKCERNGLTSLVIKGAIALEILHSGYNQLSSLDVSTNVALKDLECYSNPLVALDLNSKNQAPTGP